MPVFSLNPYAATRLLLSTLKGTTAEVVVLPAASLAFADKLWVPLLAVIVFHETEYGAVRSSDPSTFPSNKNCTPTTPTLSDAVAVTLIVPDTGDVVGGSTDMV